MAKHEQSSFYSSQKSSQEDSKHFSRLDQQEDNFARTKITLEYYKQLVKHEQSELTKIRLMLVIAANKGSGLFDGSEFKQRFEQPVADLLEHIDELLNHVADGKDVGDEMQKMIEEFELWKATSQS